MKITFPTGVWIDEIEVGHDRVLEYCYSGGVCEGYPAVQGPERAGLVGRVGVGM